MPGKTSPPDRVSLTTEHAAVHEGDNLKLKIQTRTTITAALCLATAGLVIYSTQGTVAVSAASEGPRYTADGKLLQPMNYRDWVFIGATVTPNGLNKGKAGFPEFHNVYVEQSKLAAYRKTGRGNGPEALSAVSFGSNPDPCGSGRFESSSPWGGESGVRGGQYSAGEIADGCEWCAWRRSPGKSLRLRLEKQ